MAATRSCRLSTVSEHTMPSDGCTGARGVGFVEVFAVVVAVVVVVAIECGL